MLCFYYGSVFNKFKKTQLFDLVIAWESSAFSVYQIEQTAITECQSQICYPGSIYS